MKLKPGRLTAIIKGAVASIGAMALYAISLGCFTALMLLVISMEEGGENLPSSAIPLTQAVILLSQGTGFVIGSINLTITPLLLTILLILLIAQCARKAGGGVVSWGVGLVIWVALNLMCANGTSIQLHDPAPAIIGRTALVWTLGYLLGALPGSGVVSNMRIAVKERVDRRLYDCILLALLMVAILLAVAVVAGLVVVIVWIVRDWQGMATLFDMDGMENGSRILTTIASCAWLPNLMIWAVSWLLGAGFHIGDLGVFTLWAGQSAGLPPLPVFGLLPEGVGDDRIRLALQCIIPGLYAFVALLAMLLPGPMKVRPIAPGDDEGLKALIVVMLCHLGVLAGSAVLALGLFAGGFALSNGALGTQRLAHVGVDIVPSLQVVGRALGFGLAVSWLAVTVVLAAVYGIHWIVEHHAGRLVSRSTSVASETDPGAKDSGRTRVMPLRSAGAEKSGKDDEHKERDKKKSPDAKPETERRPRSIRSDGESAKWADDRRAQSDGEAPRAVRTAEGMAGRATARPAARVARSVRSARPADSARGASAPMKLDEQPSKEENDDNNQPSD